MSKLGEHPRHAEAYGDAVSGALRATGRYDESQCKACPHDHRCCDMIVTCTPYEAWGIIEWVIGNLPDPKAVFARVFARSHELYEFMQGRASVVDDWFKVARKKCVFYDQEQSQCSIYPVRPVNCRKAWGKGDCESGGVQTEAEGGALMAARASRVVDGYLASTGAVDAEMNWLIAHLLGKGSAANIQESTQKLMRADPTELTQDELLFGFGGPDAWIEQPFNIEPKESNHGNPRNAV